MLKYTGVKIELIRNISIFDYVNSSILGGICISSQNIADDKNGVISSCDIASLYPYIMTKKLPRMLRMLTQTKPEVQIGFLA